ncbi:TetR family transcriptional regulator [Sphaerisporangium sp. TRM90804]|uniref:acyl-CoA-like ligand-binding transcription factor n=1 Tax=Sphaerisporangium sp. TRM90804 TaxID=3031113 RepID=UPI00244D5CDE|nr:TetR family transcriptional regulator [Sphaerisporangium sp. TRM90804]MDH2430505.1 TetR family transcriptional regulator [Sphaerisporangium sp. TRM90804]
MTPVESSEKPGRRDRKKLETRAALEHAALRLVAERGLAGVTVEDIAEAVDVSSRTFFNYFPSKEDAIIGTPTSEVELSKRLTAAPAGLSALQALGLALREEAELIQTQRDKWLLRLKVFESNPSLLSRLVAGGAEAERGLAAAVAERAGGADDGFAHLVTAVSLAAFRVAMVRWYAADGGPSLAGLVDQTFSRLAAGLPDPAPLPS